MLEISSNNPECVLVDIVLHNVCNFSCSYCHEDSNSGSQRWHEDFKPYINFVNYLKSKNKNVYVALLGGEPTLWPYLQEFIAKINDESTIVEWYTNGSRTLRYWKEFEPSFTRMVMSWHNEEVDDDHYFEVAKIMQDKLDVMCTILVTPDVFDRAERLIERLKSLNISITAKRVRHHYHRPEFMSYSDEQKKKIAEWRYRKRRYITSTKWEYPHQVKIDGKYLTRDQYIDLDIDTKGWNCEAGIKRFVIFPDGTVKRCSQVQQSIGNIFSEYTLYTEPKPCPINKCVCATDVVINKYAPKTIEIVKI